MDWQSEAERKMMERIFALLVALAGLADRAARLPALIRHPVLAILARGEAVARAYVMQTAFGGPGRPEGAKSLAAGDAGRLATSFRALALVLGVLLGVGPERAWIPANAGGPLGGLAMRSRRRSGQNDLWPNLARPLHHAARGPPPP